MRFSTMAFGIVSLVTMLLSPSAFAGLTTFTQFCWASTPDSTFGHCQNQGTGAQTTSSYNVQTPNPDGTSAVQTITGNAYALATPNQFKMTLSLGFTNYRRDNYIFSTDPTTGNLYWAAQGAAWATQTDSVTVTGGSGVYDLSYILGLSGSLFSSDPGLLTSQFCATLSIPNGTGTATQHCVSAPNGIPSTITLSYADLPFGGPIVPTLEIALYQVVPAINQNDPTSLGSQTFTASSSGDFGSTVTLDGLLVTDPTTGQPLKNIHVDSANGYQYPVNPANLSSVPEPPTALLLGAALAFLCFARRGVRRRGSPPT